MVGVADGIGTIVPAGMGLAEGTGCALPVEPRTAVVMVPASSAAATKARKNFDIFVSLKNLCVERRLHVLTETFHSA